MNQEPTQNEPTKSKQFSTGPGAKEKVDMVLQGLLGALLLVFGLNKFFGFMSMPEMSEPAQSFMKALMESGYVMPMVGVTEVVVGVLLLSRSWSALGLLLLAPLSVNIILFHLVLDPSTIMMAAVVAALNVYLLFVYKPKYEPVLKRK